MSMEVLDAQNILIDYTKPHGIHSKPEKVMIAVDVLINNDTSLREELAALKAENNRHHEAFCEISNGCIGAIAMSVPLEAESIGLAIYVATGLANPELNEYVAQIEAGL